MMNVTFLCMGHLKEKYLEEACAEYFKRLTAFCKPSIMEIIPESLPAKPSKAQIDGALKKEGAKLLAAVPKNSCVFALCIEGKQLSSEQFSKTLDRLAVSGNGNITFIIGSSYGLSPEVKQFADFKLSMSGMTFPHQLARVMLLEQVYRAFQISSGGKYHK